MRLPFGSEAFFEIFRIYNTGIWPLQVLIYLVSLMVLGWLIKQHKLAGKAVFYLLALLWLINGIGYHLIYFSAINKAAFAFGAMFVIQALIYVRHAWELPPTAPKIKAVRWVTAAVLIGYAMFFYPLIGYYSGHQYPRAPVFGVAPCPTTIFTFGILLITDRIRWQLYVIPLIWTLVGSSAAFMLGVQEDFGLALAAIIFIGLQMSRRFFRVDNFK